MLSLGGWAGLGSQTDATNTGSSLKYDDDDVDDNNRYQQQNNTDEWN